MVFMFYVGDVQQRRGPVESGENPTSGPAMAGVLGDKIRGWQLFRLEIPFELTGGFGRSL